MRTERGLGKEYAKKFPRTGRFGAVTFLDMSGNAEIFFLKFRNNGKNKRSYFGPIHFFPSGAKGWSS